MFPFEHHGQWANLLTAISAWHYTFTLSPGTRATLLSPASPVSRRAAVIWLLLAPSIMAILWLYLPQAAPTFGLVTAFMVWYHRKHLETLKISEETPRQEKSDVQAIIDQLGGLGHSELLVIMTRAQRNMAYMPMSKDRKAAMLQVLDALMVYKELCLQSDHNSPSDAK